MVKQRIITKTTRRFCIKYGIQVEYVLILRVALSRKKNKGLRIKKLNFGDNTIFELLSETD